MKAVLEELYASILNFLMKAYEWYNEGKLSHILHGVSQPWHRVNAGLVDEIAEKSRSIDQLAAAASQAELRDMHKKIEAIQSQLQLVVASRTEPRDMHQIFAVIQHLSVTKMDDVLDKMACKFKCPSLRIKTINRLIFGSIPCHSVKFYVRYQPTSFGSSDITNPHSLIQCFT